MIVRFIKPFGKWIPGQTPDLLRSKALELIERGIAAPYTGKNHEAAKDVAAINGKKEEEQTPIVVVLPANNSITTPEEKPVKKI